MLDELEALGEKYAGALAWTMTSNQLLEAIPRLARVRNQHEAIGLAMLREADRHQVGDPLGAANTAGWFANVTRTAKPAAHKAVALATQLDEDQHTVGA